MEHRDNKLISGTDTSLFNYSIKSQATPHPIHISLGNETQAIRVVLGVQFSEQAVSCDSVLHRSSIDIIFV